MGGAIAMQGVVQSHVFPSSGMTSLPGGQFVSCSRDKSVLQFSSPEHQPAGMFYSVLCVMYSIH